MEDAEDACQRHWGQELPLGVVRVDAQEALAHVHHPCACQAGGQPEEEAGPGSRNTGGQSAQLTRARHATQLKAPRRIID